MEGDKKGGNGEERLGIEHAVLPVHTYISYCAIHIVHC